MLGIRDPPQREVFKWFHMVEAWVWWACWPPLELCSSSERGAYGTGIEGL